MLSYQVFALGFPVRLGLISLRLNDTIGSCCRRLLLVQSMLRTFSMDWPPKSPGILRSGVSKYHPKHSTRHFWEPSFTALGASKPGSPTPETSRNLLVSILFIFWGNNMLHEWTQLDAASSLTTSRGRRRGRHSLVSPRHPPQANSDLGPPSTSLKNLTRLLWRHPCQFRGSSKLGAPENSGNLGPGNAKNVKQT